MVKYKTKADAIDCSLNTRVFVIDPVNVFYRSSYCNDNTPKLTKQLKEIESFKNKLFIQLSYENDSSKLIETLKEFGIII